MNVVMIMMNVMMLMITIMISRIIMMMIVTIVIQLIIMIWNDCDNDARHDVDVVMMITMIMIMVVIIIMINNDYNDKKWLWSSWRLYYYICNDDYDKHYYDVDIMMKTTTNYDYDM